MHVLILAGTPEARALSEALADHPELSATVSLAGRTAHPESFPLPLRQGGFGGVAGLADYLRSHGIGAMVDATHPFAADISANAASAAQRADVPLVALERPPWKPHAGEHWIRVADLEAAAEALRPLGQRVLVTTGRQNLAPYEQLPGKRYVVRTIEPPDPPPALPNAVFLQDRGPFDPRDEAVLMETHGIEVLVTKNSGGESMRGKLEAAAERGIPVVMVERPPKPPEVAVHPEPEGVLRWLEARAQGDHSPPSK